MAVGVIKMDQNPGKSNQADILTKTLGLRIIYLSMRSSWFNPFSYLRGVSEK